MMNKNIQLAQTGTETGTVTTTNCSICRGKKIEKREAINRALGKGISYRDIEAMTGVAYRTIGNHAQHLPAIFREAKEKGILGQSVDVHQEFSEQLQFAKKMRVAAQDYLSHPDTGEICLFPRSDEITVVYEDLQDLTAKGEPKRKSDTLDILLERVKTGSVEPQRTIIKHVDMRSFALDAIRTADMCVDKFAKLAGEYQKDRENSDELGILKRQIEKVALDHGTDYQTELTIFLQEYSDKIKPDLKVRLASELLQ